MIYLSGDAAMQFAAIERVTLETITHTREVYKTLAQAAQYVYGAGVKGDLAEFGTMTARTAVCLAVAANAQNQVYANDPRGTKRVHFFDSFAGLPDVSSAVDQQSPHVKQGIWHRGACKVLDAETFSDLIARYLPPHQYTVHQGWFCETVPASNEPLSLLHVDGDLYQSAIDVLAPVFDKGLVQEGAIILFDDFDCNAAHPELGERRAWREIRERYSVECDDLGRYGWAGRRFIVHRYRATAATARAE